MRQIALFEQGIAPTPIEEMSGDYGKNRYYIKREDMIPFSFGGNKARKAAEFYKEIKACGADVVMTYGSNSSNHCRIIANMACAMGLDCHIISPEENRERLYNTRLVEACGAVIETCPVSKVSETIDRRVEAYRREGRKPYFAAGKGRSLPAGGLQPGGDEACRRMVCRRVWSAENFWRMRGKKRVGRLPAGKKLSVSV